MIMAPAPPDLSRQGRRRSRAAAPAPVAEAPAPAFAFDGMEALRALRLVVRIHAQGGRIRLMPASAECPACICIEPATLQTEDAYSEALLSMRALSRLLDPWTDELGTFLVEATAAHVSACLARASAWRDVDGAFERLLDAEPHLAHELNVHLNCAEVQAAASDWKALARSLDAALNAADRAALVNLRPASVQPDITNLFGGRR